MEEEQEEENDEDRVMGGGGGGRKRKHVGQKSLTRDHWPCLKSLVSTVQTRVLVCI